MARVFRAMLGNGLLSSSPGSPFGVAPSVDERRGGKAKANKSLRILPAKIAVLTRQSSIKVALDLPFLDKNPRARSETTGRNVAAVSVAPPTTRPQKKDLAYEAGFLFSYSLPIRKPVYSTPQWPMRRIRMTAVLGFLVRLDLGQLICQNRYSIFLLWSPRRKAASWAPALAARFSRR